MGECVPGITADFEYGCVGFEDAVAEIVLAQILPDIFHRVEFRAIRRQMQEVYVRRDLQFVISSLRNR
jgi:hypothetical protein